MLMLSHNPYHVVILHMIEIPEHKIIVFNKGSSWLLWRGYNEQTFIEDLGRILRQNWPSENSVSVF